jgi:allantoate deiminase
LTASGSAAQAVVDHCRRIAAFSDESGATTRTFLSPAMRACLEYFSEWARRIGLSEVRVDGAGNFRAVLAGRSKRRLIIGSHLDTVPQAGAFDGVLGVVTGMAIAESFVGEPPECTVEVVGFSEEEGVRFARPFIGSTAFVRGLNQEFLGLADQGGITVQQALSDFGLDVNGLHEPLMNPDSAAYLEFHIEQGPLLESLGLQLGVVEAIAGQTRAVVRFTGRANHAGTTPMYLRLDAFCGAAEWTLAVERVARECPGLVATVGSVQVSPNAGNVVPAQAGLSLDLRHAKDETRLRAFEELQQEGDAIGRRRSLKFSCHVILNQAAVAMDPALVRRAETEVEAVGVAPHRMTSGAGHDAMILAGSIPSAMIFLRSPGGISHQPDEDVSVGDVALALKAGHSFVENFG